MENIKYELLIRDGDSGRVQVTLIKGRDRRVYTQDIIGLNKHKDVDAFLANYANEYYKGVFGVYAFEPVPPQRNFIQRVLGLNKSY